MKLLDSNIIIYSGKLSYSYLRSLITDPESIVSIITIMETLGYHKITDDEKLYLQSVYQLVSSVPISTEIVSNVISIRQQKKVSLGDAIIAATAIIYDCTLYTHNIKDFADIEGLKIIDPIL